MKILACGSREWTDETMIHDWLVKVAYEGFDERGTTVIHGAARGADRLAARVAERLRMTVVAFPADWDRHGRAAGFVRNVQMLDERPDVVLAFTTGSRGTQHTIDQARRRGIKTVVVTA